MTRIDPSLQLLAQIRAQALNVRKQVGERDPERQRAEVTETKQDWLGQVAVAVKGINPDDPQRQRKAFRLFLQAALARECRVTASDDPGFQDLVDRVHEAMEGDPRLRVAIASAGDQLLRDQVR